MEKRQLNLNAPLISVRRISSPSHSGELVKRKFTERPLLPPSRQQSLPPNISGYEYEVTNPVAVPFHWEQIPGRAKGETPARTPEEPSSIPRLPPGRLSDNIRRYSGETPRLPPRRVPSSFSGEARYNNQNIYRSQVEAFSSNDHAKLLEKLNESLKYNNESDSESEADDVYSDALDMLSPTESWSLNYSVSGLSGYNNSTGGKPSGTFSIDTQTRDLMMNRFLHASKAAVIETPRYAVKKPPVINEQLKKPVLGERKKFEGYGSVALPYYGHYKDSVGSEDEEEKLSCVLEKKMGKTWGSILPKFCRKNVLCRLNPLPALKAKIQTPIRSTGEIRRLTRNAHSGPLDKKASPVPQKKKFHSGLLSRDLPELQKKLTNDPSQFINARDAYSLRCRRSGSISPYRNETPKSPFREGVGFLGVPKEIENHNDVKIASSRKFFKALQDVSRNQIERENAMEKTVCVDSVEKIEFPVLKSPLRKSEAKEIPYFFEEKKVSPKFGRVLDLVENSKVKWSSDQEFKSSEYKEVRLYIKVEGKDENGEELDDKREFDSTLLKSPLPPPLPKSPSESWLWRTLPSISLGNPFSPSRRSKKTSTVDSKWETIVKTSNVRHDHVRYSEELIPHVSRRYNK